MGPLESTVGFALCGVLISIFMFGIVTVQTYMYFRSFPYDRIFLKSLVGIIWFLELGTALCLSMGTYTMVITNFGHPERLVRNPDSMNSAVLIGGMVDHLVKAIFIYRLYKFSGTLYIPIPLGLLSVFLFSIVVLSTVKALEAVPLRPHSPELEWLLSVTFVGSAVQDLMVAGSMCYYIQKTRKEALKNTTLLLDRLFIYTIQTGVATSLVAVAAAVSFFSMKDNYAWMMFFLLMHSFFSNALLSSITVRYISYEQALNTPSGAVIPPTSPSTTYKQNAIGIHKRGDADEYGSRQRHPARIRRCSRIGSRVWFIDNCNCSVLSWTNAHIISANDVYGGTFRYMNHVASKGQGLETTFLDLENAGDEEISADTRTNRNLIWIESPTSPTFALSTSHAWPHLLAHIPSPRANVAMLSLTKYINGHSEVVMGAPILPEYHEQFAERLRFLQVAVSAVPKGSKDAASQDESARNECTSSCQGTRVLAARRRYIRDLLPIHGTHSRTNLSHHMHAVVAEKFLISTLLFTPSESLGGVESLVEYPAQITHGSILPAEWTLLGIGVNLARLSVGVEEEDLVQDVL
ncbi:pyridoxal phosphate-dependent transferase [Crucibulum laeve]|uniref:cystathionine gamma-lyase n=1 Tax=Crucibulum laeve TaxID=68775 RepID=A0A5C3LSC4_9AGAR|nr:pyridoxal phosphate-dependent transferase [Crucibulum laeve]